jgi:hypothetical protein
LEAAAIAGDGGLWSLAVEKIRFIPSTPQPLRLGSSSDWKQLSAGSQHFLALKNDGTLWGWAQSMYGELDQVVSGTYFRQPIQIGTDSDWAFCFAGPQISIGIKTDGTAWCWGAVADRYPNITRKAPMTLPFNGRDLVALSGNNWACSYRLKNGTTGHFSFLNPRFLFQPITSIHTIETPDPGQFRGLVIKNDGTLAARWYGYNDFGAEAKISRNTDWLAVSSYFNDADGITSLSADGTLSLWESGWHFRRYFPLGLELAPKRGPVYSLNIFANPAP